MWAEEGEERKNAPPNLMAPKLPLPTHSESYNPPEEYLPSDKEKRAWEATAPEERSSNYLPQKFACLRRVPLYANFVKERYERCLDLYLCPRTLKRKINIDRDTLLPQLPNIAELRPFPTAEALQYVSQQGRVRSVHVDANAYYMATGGDGCEGAGGDTGSRVVHLTEILTGRVVKKYQFPAVVQQVRWNPNPLLSDVLAVVCESAVYFLDTGLSGNAEVHRNCQDLLHSRRRVGVVRGGEG